MLAPSEQIELLALKDLQQAASADIASALGLSWLEQDSVAVSIASQLPESAIVINRALGLGMSTPATEPSVENIIAAYRESHVRRFFLHKHPAARPPELTDWFIRLGLAKARSWQKFSRGRQSVPATSTDLSLKEIGPEYGTDFGRIAGAAFDLGEQSTPWLAKLPGRKGWHIFMSFDNGEPAGVGALFIWDKYAWTDFGATAPMYRRRGSQAALLAERIRCALDAGCEEIFTCTGEAVEGDPQHSYKNIKKAGFTETYLRENYAPSNVAVS